MGLRLCTRRHYKSAHYLLALALIGLGGSGTRVWAANEVFDARGFAPNRDFFSQLPYEHIDPLTGNLLLTFTDLVLPGNAGFDLKIQRTYNSKIFKDYDNFGDGLDEDSWAGIGWSFHLGRVLHTPSGIPAAVELPDGSRHKLYHHISPNASLCPPNGTGCYITRDFWVYASSANPPLLRSPDGTQYTLGQSTAVGIGGVATPVRYPTRIEDPFGNFFTIAYMSLPEDGIQSITQDLGGGQVRTVTFTVIGTRRTLNTMSYAGSTTHTWTYTQVDANSVGYSRLTEVRPPIGPSWRYQYDTVAPVQNELIGVTTPQGGQIDYTYADKTFHLGSTVPVTTRSVVQRSVSGRGVTTGTWTYAYALGTSQNQGRITSPSPCGTITTTYTFKGVGNYSSQGEVWRIGLLESKVVADGGGSLETESLNWTPSALISNDIETVGFNQDVGISVPLVSTRTLTRGGQNYLTTNTYSTNVSTFNDYGRPYQIDENGDLTGTRRTSRVFQYGFGPYIVDRIASETVTVGSESFAKSYSYNSANGFKTSQAIYGITTSYTPTPSRGNVASSTNNSNTTTYAYDWGLASAITTPMYPITRVINPEGTIASQTRQYWNGSSNLTTTTSFQYDAAFRPTRRTPQVGNLTATSYDNTGGTWVQVTRGASRTTTNLDGLGRSVGTSNSVGIQTRIDYDACGRKSYESYPQTGAPETTHGTGYSYDALDRVTRKTNNADNPDSVVSYAYGPGLQVEVTDENNHTTTHGWKAFGDPSGARLMSVTEANGRRTDYTYNTLGSLTRVTHPGAQLSRTWTYFATTGLLQQETHPESGTVSYTYDAAGNVQTRTDFRGQTTYGYDGNNRLTGITRPSGFTAYNTTLQYDGSDQRKLAQNSYVSSSFAYDAASRLVSRTDTVNARTFTTGYPSYDGNDNLQQLNYPSGTQVTYAYDSENRISSVGKPGVATFFAGGFTYHPSGAVGSFQPGGSNSLQQFGYDGRYRLQSVNTGAQNLNLTYSYDFVGNATGITDTRPGMNQGFTYDALDRLLTGSGYWGSGGFGYDDLGNRTSTSIGGSVNFTYSSSTNRLASAAGVGFSYDANGNTTSDGTINYTYTPENVVETAAGATYRYDGDNLRKMKIGADIRYYLHGPGNQILSEYQQSGSCPVLPVRDYVYAGGRLLASVQPAIVTLQVSPASSWSEGAGSAALVVTLLTSDGLATTSAVTVNYATSNGTAVAPSDYTAVSGTLTFPSGSANGASQTINVPIVNDTVVEPDETFTLMLSSPSCGTLLGTASQTVTIQDDDATVALTSATSSVTEGIGTAAVIVKLTTSHGAATTNPVSVTYQTANGTAVAGSDYGTTSGTLTFPTGAVSGATQTISVPIINDTLDEDDEDFTMSLSGASGGALGSPSTTTVTILDDDPAPSISIKDVAVSEPVSGTRNAAFTVSLSTPSGRTVSVGYSTADGTATAGSDYASVSGTLFFTPGTASQAINVPVLADTVVEPPETFSVNLTNPVNAVLADAQGAGTILDRTGCDVLITSVPYTITVQGNYCLANHITVTSMTTGSAITVDANAVVLDLRGYKLLSFGAGTGTQAFGISVLNHNYVVIRNCIVTGTGGSTAPGASGWASAGISLGSSTSLAINNSVTGTTPTSGGTVSYGVYVGTDGRAVSNQVVGNGDTPNASNMCFAFGTGVLYKNNAASRCGTLYSGGIAVGATNHP